MNCKECENFERRFDTTQGGLDKYCINYKPKEDIIYVPEGIEFEDGIGRCGVGLKFGDNRSLFYDSNYESWVVNKFRDSTKIKTKLTPCKREDLKPGDWGYCSDILDPTFTNKYFYALIINSNKSYTQDRVFVWHNKEIREGRYMWNNWWKVEKA